MAEGKKKTWMIAIDSASKTRFLEKIMRIIVFSQKFTYDGKVNKFISGPVLVLII